MKCSAIVISKFPPRHRQIYCGVAIIGLLSALGGRDVFASPTPSNSIGGTVSGLRNNTTLILKDNNSDQLSISSNGSFVFPTLLAVNSNYSVTVSQQPLRQTCTITNGAGTETGDVSNVAITCAPKFTVFEYVKLRNYRDSTGPHTLSSGYIPDAWFQSFNVSPINLNYSGNLVNCPASELADHCTLHRQKVTSVADGADSTDAIPVSLDLEVWDTYRSKPNSATGNGQTIVQNLTSAIQMFKGANAKALVGLYGEAPQTTFGWNANTSANYKQLNQDYASIAALVDYFSPVLYNYGYDGTAAGDSNWESAMTFNVQQAQTYNSGSNQKDNFPYISPGWVDSAGKSQLLSYDQMMFRLKALKASVATGCIVWISSRAVDANGAPVVVDATSGWFKAIVDFAAANQ